VPRVLALPVVLAAIALTLLTGCASGTTGPGPAGPATALTLPARSSSTGAGSSTAAAPPADGDDVSACFDGDCEVRVPDGTTIQVDPRFDVDGILVTVRDGRARIRIDTGTGYVTAGGTGSTSIYNDLSVKVLGVDGDRALIRLRSS
jgi:hypothetical protein